jgi:phage gpG-like protein
MESKIKWQTGKPKEEGKYLVSAKNGNVLIDVYSKTLKYGNHWVLVGDDNVVAWCSLSDIEPYKE